MENGVSWTGATLRVALCGKLTQYSLSTMKIKIQTFVKEEESEAMQAEFNSKRHGLSF